MRSVTLNLGKMRKSNLATLTKLGFTVGKIALDDAKRRLRPVREIATRAMALQALFLWAGAPDADFPSRTVRAFAKRSALETQFTVEERAIFAMPRAKAQAAHGETIGWRLENLWPLAWILGFEPPPACDGKAIDPTVAMEMLFEFLPRPLDTLDELEDVRARPLDEVAAVEDLFFCAHGAVRAAAAAGDKRSVPKKFDAVLGAGVIHERRHALTWALSPRVTWAKTDLSV